MERNNAPKNRKMCQKNCQKIGRSNLPKNGKKQSAQKWIETIIDKVERNNNTTTPKMKKNPSTNKKKKKNCQQMERNNLSKSG